MDTFRRRLPHLSAPERAVFVTWRLHGTLPPNRHFPTATTTNSGKCFATMDRLLHQERNGPSHLRKPEIATLVAAAIAYNAEQLNHYRLHAFVVMPNHVHLLITPTVRLAILTKSLKGITAKQANQILGLTGSPFWQEESYDRLIRDQDEFERVRHYVEDNPVRAGLCKERSEYRWSSAFTGVFSASL